MSSKHQKGYMPWDRTGNRLLVKSQLGANKPTNYQIPQQEFVYGRITPEDPEHSNQVMYQWKYHQPSANINHLKQKDLINTNKQAILSTNKEAIKDLNKTFKQFSRYRKSNTLYKPAKEGTNVVPIKLPEEGHTYGKPLELEDPIRLVISNSYGEDDKLARHTFYANQTQVSSAPNRKLSCYITKNHNLVKEAATKRLAKFDWAKRDEGWKLNKFKDINYKVDTRRPRADSVK